MIFLFGEIPSIAKDHKRQLPCMFIILIDSALWFILRQFYVIYRVVRSKITVPTPISVFGKGRKFVGTFGIYGEG